MLLAVAALATGEKTRRNNPKTINSKPMLALGLSIVLKRLLAKVNRLACLGFGIFVLYLFMG